jgi:hypothetical protein
VDSPACGPQHRSDIIEQLRRSFGERQNDPRADPDEIAELLALLIRLGAAP